MLQILEKGLAKGLSLESIDDHDALVSVLPEFKVGGGHMWVVLELEMKNMY